MPNRNSANIQHFKQLDGFRFFSVIAVMISHFASCAFVDRFPLGFGVLFFFVLSSFLITRILLHAKLYNEANGLGNFYSLRQFYLRRFLRIFPIYYLLIAVMYIVNWVPVREILVSLLSYTTNFKIASGSNAGNFGHLWSLSVEEQFYVFFPFFILFVNTRFILKALIVLTVIGVVGRSGLYAYNDYYIPFSNLNTISCLDSLGIGAILAYLSINKVEMLKKIMSNQTYFYLSLSLFLLTMLFSFTFQSPEGKLNYVSLVLMRFLFNVASFWILGRAVTLNYQGVFKKILENRFVIYLGRISYGLYLYHLFVPRIVDAFLRHFAVNISNWGGYAIVFKTVINIAVTICIASGSWYLIEKPLNSFKQYFKYNKTQRITLPALEGERS